MVIKYGRYGKFLACPGYPECKNAKPIIETIDVPCPVCGGKVQVKNLKEVENFMCAKTIQIVANIYHGTHLK